MKDPGMLSCWWLGMVGEKRLGAHFGGAGFGGMLGRVPASPGLDRQLQRGALARVGCAMKLLVTSRRVLSWISQELGAGRVMAVLFSALVLPDLGLAFPKAQPLACGAAAECGAPAAFLLVSWCGVALCSYLYRI